MTSSEYAARIRAIIKLGHTPIGVIEEECGVAKGYLSRLILNKHGHNISFELAQKFAEATGYSFIDVLTRDIPKEHEMFEVRKELREIEERAKGLRKLLEENDPEGKA